MHITLTPTPDADTAAAVIAAIAAMVAPADEATLDTPARSAWHAGGALAAQGLPPARSGAFAAWHAADRARRAERWSGGITGL